MHTRRPVSCAFAVIAALPLSAMAQVATTPAANSSPVADSIRPVVEGHAGEVAVFVRHLPTGETFAHNAKRPMPTASLIKTAVMVEAYRQAEAGKLDLDQRITMKAEDRTQGSGILNKHFAGGLQLTLRDAIGLMMAVSDNTATNLVLDQIGLASVSSTTERLGLPNTKLHAKVYRRDTSLFPERSREFGLGSTTAEEMAQLMQWIWQGKVAKSFKKAMLEHLHDCEDDSKIGQHLPPGLKFAHKTGAVSKVRTDAGILFGSRGPVVICVLTADNEDQSWGERNAAEQLCGAIGRIVAEHYHRDSNRAAPLSQGSTGKLVEDLQRTLNHVADEQLAVDGDFGPATKAAVLRFQQAQKLKASGIVDKPTWRALGPIVSASALPPPEEVNARPVKRQPMDDLTGPPFVSCRAWSIADARSGKVLWEHNGAAPRDNASTTKIMTAWVVMELAGKDPNVLKETIEFSRRADRTRGSTAGIREGERLSVEELLYGLLLPSGNDASVALAEHFGARAAAHFGVKQELSDPLQQFIAAMNQGAEQLVMKSTAWKNPHGLTARGHHTSPNDLVRLTLAAREHALFRKITGTQQHGCQVRGASGYRRNLVWNNTNRLLRTEGYHGVKTGTTSAAGACLVSCGQRSDEQLIVVVLGSSGSNARYADSRNLYRWAWQQLGVRQKP